MFDLQDVNLEELRGRDAWQILVQYFAEGRGICNCGEAYTVPCPGSINKDDPRWCGCVRAGGGPSQPHGRCEHGCSAAQFNTRNDIARKVLALLKEAEDTLKFYAEQGRVVVARDGNLIQRLLASAEIAIQKAQHR